MFADKTDDDAYVFWYAAPATDSPAAFAALVSGWVKAGVVPRQGTPFEVARRGPEGAVQVKQHAPPRTPEDVLNIFGGDPAVVVPQAKGQADLYLAGAVVRARVEFEYLGEDELTPPRVDPRRPFMQGVLFLPQYWREKAKGYEGDDPGGAAVAIEDALTDKYLVPLCDQSAPIAMFSGPEHDNVRWRFTEAELAGPLPPRLSELSRYATFLSPAQVSAVGREHFERLARTFEWLHRQEPRLKPVCRMTQSGGAVVSRWPGALDKEPRFAEALPSDERESLNRLRAALAPAAR
jgi:hypothetical protein